MEVDVRASSNRTAAASARRGAIEVAFVAIGGVGNWTCRCVHVVEGSVICDVLIGTNAMVVRLCGTKLGLGSIERQKRG